MEIDEGGQPGGGLAQAGPPTAPREKRGKRQPGNLPNQPRQQQQQDPFCFEEIGPLRGQRLDGDQNKTRGPTFSATENTQRTDFPAKASNYFQQQQQGRNPQGLEQPGAPRGPRADDQQNQRGSGLRARQSASLAGTRNYSRQEPDWHGFWGNLGTPKSPRAGENRGQNQRRLGPFGNSGPEQGRDSPARRSSQPYQRQPLQGLEQSSAPKRPRAGYKQIQSQNQNQREDDILFSGFGTEQDRNSSETPLFTRAKGNSGASFGLQVKGAALQNIWSRKASHDEGDSFATQTNFTTLKPRILKVIDRAWTEDLARRATELLSEDELAQIDITNIRQEALAYYTRYGLLGSPTSDSTPQRVASCWFARRFGLLKSSGHNTDDTPPPQQLLAYFDIPCEEVDFAAWKKQVDEEQQRLYGGKNMAPPFPTGAMTPNLGLFLNQINGFIDAQNEAQLADWLVLEPPFSTQYVAMIGELQQSYPKGSEDALETKCSQSLTIASRGFNDSPSWTWFIKFMVQYLGYLRDVDADPNKYLETYELLYELQK